MDNPQVTPPIISTKHQPKPRTFNERPSTSLQKEWTNRPESAPIRKSSLRVRDKRFPSLRPREITRASRKRKPAQSVLLGAGFARYRCETASHLEKKSYPLGTILLQVKRVRVRSSPRLLSRQRPECQADSILKTETTMILTTIIPLGSPKGF